MPIVLPAAQIQRGPEWANLEANQQGFQSLLGGLASIQDAQKQNEERRQMALLAQVLQEPDPVKRQAGLVQLVSPQQPEQGMLGKVFNSVNPMGRYNGTTGMQAGIANALLGQALNPYEQPMQKAKLEGVEQANRSAGWEQQTRERLQPTKEHRENIAWNAQIEEWIREGLEANTREEKAAMDMKLAQARLNGMINDQQYEEVKRNWSMQDRPLQQQMMNEEVQQSKQQTQAGEQKLQNMIEDRSLDIQARKLNIQGKQQDIEQSKQYGNYLQDRGTYYQNKMPYEQQKAQEAKRDKLIERRDKFIIARSKALDDDSKKYLDDIIKELDQQIMSGGNSGQGQQDEQSVITTIQSLKGQGRVQEARQIYDQYKSTFGWE